MNDVSSSQVALITGGPAGLSKATAMELARRGWSIFLQHAGPQEAADQAVADILAAAEEAAQQIEAAAGGADLTVSADREQLVESVIEDFGRIDMLVNAAAGPPGAAEDLLEITEDSYAETMNATLTATLFLTQIVASEMVRLTEAGLIDNPKIVTLNSVGAYAASAGHGPHCISRAGLAMVTKLFADRLAAHGINVYEVRVGFVAAEPAAPGGARHEEAGDQAATPIPRRGWGDDVARAVAAIAEDLLSFSTGEVINVDGGFHLRKI